MQQWNKSILLGCALIAIGVVVAATVVGNTIARYFSMSQAYVFPAIDAYNRSDWAQTGDYMFDYEAAQYCRIDTDAFDKLLDDGKLEGTYIEIPAEKTVVDEEAYADILKEVPEGAPSPEPPVITVPGVERVFVKAKLDEWMLAQMAP